MADKTYFNPFRKAGYIGATTTTANIGLQERSVADAASPMQQLTAEENLFIFVNKTGSTIEVGSVLIPDITAGAGLITVVTAATIANSTAQTLANNLSTEAGLFRLIFTTGTGNPLADSLVIVGVDQYGNTITETKALTAAQGVWVSANLWQSITSITTGAAHAANSATLAVTAKAVNALCPAGATDDLTTVVGFCRGAVDGMPGTAVPDEGYGYVSMLGPITQALVNPLTQTGGETLATSATTAGTLEAATTKTPMGIAIMLDANGATQASATLLWIMGGGAAVLAASGAY